MHNVRATQTIMIVEDSDDDFDAAQSALQGDNNFCNPLVRCETGQEALDYLFATGPYAPPYDRPPVPGLILLDLNLPGVDGREVLAQIKNDHMLCLIPVVVMTMSDNPIDIEECYRIGANTYVVKPMNLNSFFAAISRLKEYWFEIALLPSVEKI